MQLHSYTQALLSVVPIPNPGKSRKRHLTVLTSDVPSPLNPPFSFRFYLRCPIAKKGCSKAVPAWREIKPGHWMACHEVK